MNRRTALRTLAAGGAAGALAAGAVAACSPIPAMASPDPLLSLIGDYRAGRASYFEAPADLSDDEDEALAELTWRPPYARLEEDCPTPTTTAGAVAGLRLVLDEMKAGDDPGFIEGILAAVIAHLEGGA